jgi:hypothetical protein
MAELSTVTIQVVRPEDGLHTALTGQFAVLNFEDVRSIGYVEHHDGAIYIQDPARCGRTPWSRRTYGSVPSAPSGPSLSSNR